MIIHCRKSQARVVDRYLQPTCFKFLTLILAFFTVLPVPIQAATNTFFFSYTNRDALLADGWNFIATLPGSLGTGAPRNTETTNGAVVSYDQVEHPGVLRVPVDVGDLWAGYNNSRNTPFRILPTNWSSARLALSFWPTQNTQQANLLVYQDDDNYVAVAHAFNGNERVALTREFSGWPAILSTVPILATNLWLRLDRDLNSGTVTALFSLDGAAWNTVGQVWQTLYEPRLAIFIGGSPFSSNLANVDLSRLDIITQDVPPAPVLVPQPQHLVFNAIAGQPCTNRQSLRLLVRSQDPQVQWTLSTTSSWLGTDLTSSNTPSSCNISVDTGGLSAGIYEGALKATAPGSTGATIDVTLIVNPANRARVATWFGGKSGALSVSVDDSQTTAFDDLSTNGFAGCYFIVGAQAPALFTNYYLAGMELAAHTITHPCFGLNEADLRWEIETSIADICATTPQNPTNLISFAWPCGFGATPFDDTLREEAAAADYFLSARGYNFNLLEDPSPNDFMNLKSFNSHEHPPPPPADLKTVVDAAIAQGKWFNLVLHATNDDDGAIVYSVGKDIWVAPIGSVVKYILQRDRSVITNYTDNTGLVSFDCYRLPVDPSPKRSFETAFGPQDVVTMQVDATGFSSASSVTVSGNPVPFRLATMASSPALLFNLPLTSIPQSIAVQLSTNPPPFRILSTLVANSQAILTWESVPNHIYRLEYKETLESTWLEQTPDLTATGTTLSGTNQLTGSAQRFYRVLLVQ